MLKMQNRMLNDRNKRIDKNQDFGQSTFKIVFRGIFHFISVLIQILVFVQFLSNIWLLFVRIQNIYLNPPGMELVNFTPNFQSNEDWEIQTDSMFKTSITLIYFTLTSLSTVGFGDFFPKTDWERLASTIMLLVGVATFSYAQYHLVEILRSKLNSEEE